MCETRTHTLFHSFSPLTLSLSLFLFHGVCVYFKNEKKTNKKKKKKKTSFKDILRKIFKVTLEIYWPEHGKGSGK